MHAALPLACVLAGALLGPPKALPPTQIIHSGTPGRVPDLPRWARSSKPGPPPTRTIKAAEGYFEETLALDETGRYLAAVRTDGATFAKVEVFDLAAAGAEPLRSDRVGEGGSAAAAHREGVRDPVRVPIEIDIPDDALAVEALHVPPDARTVVLVSRDGGEAGAGLHATLLDAAGRALARVGPAAAFRQLAPDRLVAVERKGRAGGPTTYVVTPYALATLAPAGKPQVYGADAGGLGPAPAAPGRTRFAALMQNGAGVDIVDLMGKRMPAALAVPFGLYDPKSLRDQEGPEPGAFWFSLSVDPLNSEAIKRRKPDLPMLDLYSFDGASGNTMLRARVFTPRPVAWMAGHGKLALVKRSKGHTRGGDELQIFDLR